MWYFHLEIHRQYFSITTKLNIVLLCFNIGYFASISFFKKKYIKYLEKYNSVSLKQKNTKIITRGCIIRQKNQLCNGTLEKIQQRTIRASVLINVISTSCEIVYFKLDLDSVEKNHIKILI